MLGRQCARSLGVREEVNSKPGLPFEPTHIGHYYLAKVFWIPTLPGKLLIETPCAKFGKGPFYGNTQEE